MSGSAFSLAGRTAMITGGTRGIGAATARAFIAAGAQVAVTHLDTPEAAEQARRLIASVPEGRLRTIVADATNDDQTAEAVRAVETGFGQAPDILVINAANVGHMPWDDITLQDWEDMMAVNLRGAFLAARHAVPQMRRNGYGKIITIGSVMSKLGDPRSLHYVTTKGGIVAFTTSLARAEGRHGIRVNCVLPGAIATEQHFEFGGTAELTELGRERQCVQRRGLPEDIANACTYLTSPAADFVSAQALVVDGGWTNA